MIRKDSTNSKIFSNCTPQELLIIKIFSQKKLTPFQVLDKFEKIHPRVPITSIRRAITNLTDKGILQQTAGFKMERYGKTNKIWAMKIINK